MGAIILQQPASMGRLVQALDNLAAVELANGSKLMKVEARPIEGVVAGARESSSNRANLALQCSSAIVIPATTEPARKTKLVTGGDEDVRDGEYSRGLRWLLDR
jgi:hypothetical protein